MLKSSRKWFITINNPLTHYPSIDAIKTKVQEFKNLEYWCISEEIGLEKETPHIHIYLVRKSSGILFDSLKKRFPIGKIEGAKGNSKQAMEYVSKTGKWADDKKADTTVTFQEYGELPDDSIQGQRTDYHILHELIENGCSDVEIMQKLPQFLTKLDKIGQARQKMITNEFADTWRKLDVQYIWGATGTGKTRTVMEEYGYRNVYRVTDYKHPFDGYNSQDVIIFEEFRSSIKISDMLVYLDGYPVELPARYYNRQACFTKVFILTNIAFTEQYPNIQNCETWEAFKRRVPIIKEIPKIHKEEWVQVTDDDDDFEQMFNDGL